MKRTGGEQYSGAPMPCNAAYKHESRFCTPSLVLVRTPFDSGWHASVDGLPVRILPADYLLQAIPVPAGAHTIELSYRDPWIGLGALGSGLAILALVVWAAVLRRQKGSDEQAG